MRRSIVGGIGLGLAVAVALALWWLNRPEPVPDTMVAAPVSQATPEPAAIPPKAAPEVATAPKAGTTPKLDVVRVTPEGQAVIAGRATPGQQVEVLLDGAVIGNVSADAAGDFATVLELGPSSEARELALRTATDQATIERVALAPSVQPGTQAQSASQEAAAAAEAARLAAEKAEAARLAAEKAEAERLAAEKAEAARLAAARAETAPLAAKKAEAERLALEKAEAARLAAQKAEEARLAAEKAEAARLAAERAEAERLVAKKAEAERLAAEEADEDQLAAEKAEVARLAAERAAAERLAAEKAEAARLAAKEAAAARLAAEEAEAERLAAEKAEAERLAAEKAEAARLAAETAAAERVAAKKAEAERLAAEKAEAARLAAEKAGAERLAAAAGVEPQVPQFAESGPVIILPQADPESAPVLVKPGADDVQLLQPAAAEPATGIVLDRLTYSEHGDLIAAGRGAARTLIRIYANAELKAEVRSGEDRRWTARIPAGVAASAVLLRFDEIGADGTVRSRLETPFEYSPAASVQELHHRKIVVQKGDYLWKFAEQYYGQGWRYSVIFSANSHLIRDPDLIYPGQVFTVPELVNSQ